MRDNPTVSVILTSYNHERFLHAAIDSVLAQTFTDFQLIIADDASTDGSWDIAQSYKDDRIHLYRNKRNRRGIINTVLQSGLAKGELVAIHHSDDEWEPTKLQKQVSFLTSNPSIAAVFTRAHIINSDGAIVTDNPTNDPTLAFYLRIFDQNNRSRHEWLRYFVYSGNCLCHPSVLIRKQVYDQLGPYDIRFRQAPDFHYWIKVCLQFDIYVLQEKLTRMRIRTDNSNTSSASLRNQILSSIELTRIYEPLSSIDTTEELARIFPEILDICANDHSVPQYCLVKALLQVPNPSIKAYACGLVYDLFKDQRVSENLRHLHGFGPDCIAPLLEAHDVFGLENNQVFFDQTKRVKSLQIELDNSLALLACERRTTEARNQQIQSLQIELDNSLALLARERRTTEARNQQIQSLQIEMDNLRTLFARERRTTEARNQQIKSLQIELDNLRRSFQHDQQTSGAR